MTSEDDEQVHYPYGKELDKILVSPMDEVFEGLRPSFRMMRYQRGFSTKRYLKDKTLAINKFFTEHSLNCAILDIGDGIDSALTLYLLEHAAKQPDSSLKKIVVLSLPIHCTSTVDQMETLERSKMLVETLSSDIVEHHTYDLTTSFIEYTKHTEVTAGSLGREKLASMVRTPMLYYVASGMQEIGFQSIVVGTMNRDEGCYVGFFSKAAEAMVDLQPIADIHKSEVIQMANFMGIPTVLQSDNGRTEEMIGAPYWFLEMYILTRQTREFLTIRNAQLEPSQREACNAYIDNIEAIHKRNAHKYEVGLPSHFIDVVPRKVFGGWQ